MKCNVCIDKGINKYLNAAFSKIKLQICAKQHRNEEMYDFR